MNRLIEGFKNKHGKIFYSITKVMFFILGMALPAKIIQGRFGDKMRSLAQGSSDTVKFMGLDVISIARGTNENASKYEISRNYLYIVIPLIMGIVFFIIYTKISSYFIKRFRMNNIENRIILLLRLITIILTKLIKAIKAILINKQAKWLKKVNRNDYYNKWSIRKR